MGEFVECAEYSRVPGSTQSAREYAEYRGLPRMTRMMRITRRTVDRHGVPQSTADYRDYEDNEDGPDYVDDADHVGAYKLMCPFSWFLLFCVLSGPSTCPPTFPMVSRA